MSSAMGECSTRDQPIPNIQGVRALFDFVAAEPRLDATAIQTVGVKGWDGLMIALVS